MTRYTKKEIINAHKKGYAGGEAIKYIHQERAILSKNIGSLEKYLASMAHDLQKMKKQLKKTSH